jgi:hypothetical protein
MSRKQLFEFEDFPWFPRLIRAYMQDHLAFMDNLVCREQRTSLTTTRRNALAKLSEKL